MQSLLVVFAESYLACFAENGFMGMGIGAAMTGLRPIVEGMNMGFLLLAYNQISNNAGMLHYTSGGQYKASHDYSRKVLFLVALCANNFGIRQRKLRVFSDHLACKLLACPKQHSHNAICALYQ